MTTNLDTSPFQVDIERRATRRRSASLRHVAKNKFVLVLPPNADDAWAQNFIASRQGWMQKVHERATKLRRAQIISPNSQIVTEYFTLRIFRDDTLEYPKYRTVLDSAEGVAEFHLPKKFFASKNAENLYTHLEKYLLAQTMKRGKDALVERARQVAKQHGIRVKEFFVAVQKSRLGYCTHDDRIMLNARLLFATQKLRDYVICHELAHTKHKNHSKQYWAYLETLFPGAKACDKMLRDSSVYSMPSPRPTDTPLLKERKRERNGG